MERGYSERMFRTQIPKQEVNLKRDSLLEFLNKGILELFKITYYPTFQSARTILEELQVLLAPDQDNKKVFPEVPMVGFRNGKSLKKYLMRALLPKIDNAVGSKPCI